MKYAHNPRRKDITAISTFISKLNIVVDKLHMKGHTDPWCKANCDAKSFKELDKVGTCKSVIGLSQNEPHATEFYAFRSVYIIMYNIYTV